MSHFGFDRFEVAGHDRGARVAFRMALDYPERIERLIALDIVPTYNLLSNVTLGWGLESYHWFFMAQKAPFPEKLICADLDYYINYKLNKKGVGLSIFAPEAFAEYVRCTTPGADPRGLRGLSCDRDARLRHGQGGLEKRAARSNARCWCCGVRNSHVGRHLKPHGGLERSGPQTCKVSPIPTGHYPAEQRPDLVLSAFEEFLNGRRVKAAAA